MIVDNPPELVNVSRHDNFFSLCLGESTIVNELLLDDMVPRNDVKPGDRFRIGFEGTNVQCWDWGGPDTHENTEVYLPCFRGPVIEPPTPTALSDECPITENAGRPRLVVAAAEPADFIWV
jgi:hypothetical protein